MADVVARLRFNGGIQPVVHIPATRQASNGTWELQDLRFPSSATEYVIASGTATLDTYSESLTADAGPGQADAHRVTVATAGLVEGTTYWLSDTAGGEHVRLAGIGTGTIDLVAPLVGTYTTADSATLEGLELVASIPASASSDEERMQYDHLMRIVWIYADGSRFQQQARLRRNDHDAVSYVKARQDIIDLFPDVVQRLEHNGRSTLMRTIEVVYRMIAAMERGRGVESSLKLGGEERHFALVWKALLHMASQGMVPGTEDAEQWQEYCREQFDTFWGGTTTGEGGKESGRVIRSTEASTGTESLEHENIIQGL